MSPYNTFLMVIRCFDVLEIKWQSPYYFYEWIFKMADQLCEVQTSLYYVSSKSQTVCYGCFKSFCRIYLDSLHGRYFITHHDSYSSSCRPTVKTGISKLIMKLEFQEVKITLNFPPRYFICLDVSVYLTWRSLAKNFILNVQSWAIVSHALDSQL